MIAASLFRPRRPSASRGGEGAAPARSPEGSGVASGRILLILAGWILFVGAGLFTIRIFVSSELPDDPAAHAVHQFPSPRIQTNPQADLAALLSAQRERLRGYAWVDRTNGLVHVPIERAMQAIAARGADAYGPLQPPGTGDTARERAVDAAMRAAPGGRP